MAEFREWFTKNKAAIDRSILAKKSKKATKTGHLQTSVA